MKEMYPMMVIASICQFQNLYEKMKRLYYFYFIQTQLSSYQMSRNSFTPIIKITRTY